MAWRQPARDTLIAKQHKLDIGCIGQHQYDDVARLRNVTGCRSNLRAPNQQLIWERRLKVDND